jgi:hypothetical protein
MTLTVSLILGLGLCNSLPSVWLNLYILLYQEYAYKKALQPHVAIPNHLIRQVDLSAPDNNLTKQALNMANELRGHPSGEMFHSDQGSHCTSISYLGHQADHIHSHQE